MSEQSNPEMRVEALEKVVLQLAEQIKTLANAVEILNHGNATAPAQSVNRGRVDDDIPPPVEDLDNGYDATDFKRQLESTQKEMERKFMQTVAEKMKSLDLVDNTAMIGLPSYAEGMFPEKFKVPDFEKYDGTGCPLMHTRLYVRKMAKYVQYEHLMIHVFQDSLTGPALSWYAQLDLDHIDTWDKLAKAFYNQYKFNIEVAPTVWDLSNLKKQPTESFKEYAQRWRSMAAKITTPMPERDLTLMFINTLGNPYYQHLVGHTSSSFAEIVAAGCRIEGGIASGKLPVTDNLERKPITPKPYTKPKEATVSVLNTGNYPKPSYTFPPNPQSPNTSQPSNQSPRPQRRRQFANIPIPLSQVLDRLRKENMVTFELPREDYKPRDYNPELRCEYHLGQVGHSTDNCWRLRNKIQDLIDAKMIQLDFVEAPKPNVNNNPLPNHQPTINMITSFEPEASKENKDRMLMIGMIGSSPKTFRFEYSNEDEVERKHLTPKKLSFHVPLAPENYKAAPFDYSLVNQSPKKQPLMIGGLTRSGRVYDPAEELKRKAAVEEASKKVLEESEAAEEKEQGIAKKVMKVSEYKIMDQLAKVPAQISLLGLLMSSTAHREALFKVLDEVKVPDSVSTDKLGLIVNSVFTMDQISFSPEELGEEGNQHTKPLFIVVKCQNMVIARVLIDNGSSLNVCPLATLDLMGVDRGDLKPSSITVRAFDGSKRGVLGEVELQVEIGPQQFSIPFQVLEIPRSFNLLLGRPWIHSAGAIPSSLHQMVKFISNGQVVTILGEQDYAIYKETAIPYIGNEETEELGLQIFNEVAMVADVAGKDEGESSTLQIGTFGLGYVPTQREMQEMKRLVRGKRGDRLYHTPIEFPDIRKTFPAPAYTQLSEIVDLSKTFSCQCKIEGEISGTTAVLNNWFSIPVNRVDTLLG